MNTYKPGAATILVLKEEWREEWGKYVCIYIYTDICMCSHYICMSMQTCIHRYYYFIRTHVCMHMQMCAYAHNTTCIYIYIYINTYTKEEPWMD